MCRKDIEVKDDPDHLRPNTQRTDIARAQVSQEVVRAYAGSQLENHDIGFDGPHRNAIHLLQSPGDQLRIEVKMVRLKHSAAKIQGIATVDGQVAAEAILMCTMTDRLQSTGQPAAAQEPQPQLA